MIKFERTRVMNLDNAIYGCRNPLNSWNLSDSGYYNTEMDLLMNEPISDEEYVVGKEDLKLMSRLVKAGTSHRKFLRQIFVSVQVTAPLYWWKQMDQYKVGVTTDSCSTMHCIHKRPLEQTDFSIEHMTDEGLKALNQTLVVLENLRKSYLENHTNKDIWYTLIKLLPNCYNQTRMLTMSYENCVAIFNDRRGHKLEEWHSMCEWIKDLPYMKDMFPEMADYRKEGE